MREIKFRAWNSVDKQMWEPELSALPTGWEDTLLQYTGLKDKNGVEIYEGDIVTFQQNVYSNGTKVGVSKRTVVEYDSTDRAGFKPFCEDWDYDGMSFLDTYGECAVIGNIYENPDLLEAN